MLYEIGWSTYDIRYIIVLLCFIPLLIIFILFQKKYNTATEDIDEATIPKTSLRIVRGSKGNFKFTLSLILILLMIVSLSPIITLIIKNNTISCLKKEEYVTFIGTAELHLTDNYVTLINGSEHVSFYIDGRNNDVKKVLENNVKDGETYKIDFTYSLNRQNPTILRIEKQ